MDIDMEGHINQDIEYPLNLSEHENYSYRSVTFNSGVLFTLEDYRKDELGLFSFYGHKWEMALTGLTLALIILLTLVGNTLVILSIYTYKPLRIPQNYLIASLAVTDVTVAILVMPFSVAFILNENIWKFGKAACKLWITWTVLSCSASIFHLCAIAVDRYWIIKNPLASRHHTLRRISTIIGGVWLVSLALSTPLMASKFKNEMFCGLPSFPNYVFVILMVAYFLSLLLMMTFYVKILLAVRSSMREVLTVSVNMKNVVELSSDSRVAKLSDSKGSSDTQSTMMEDGKRDDSSDASTRVGMVKGEIVVSETGQCVLLEDQSMSLSARNGQNVRSGANGEHTIEHHEVEGNISTAKKEPISGTLGRNVVRTVEGYHLTVNEARENKELAEEPEIPSQPTPTATERPVMPRHIHQRLEERQNKLTRTLGIIMGVFVVCWLPFFLSQPIIFPCKSCTMSEPTFTAILWLGYINSTLNPFIYTVFNLEFRKAFKKLLKMKS